MTSLLMTSTLLIWCFCFGTGNGKVTDVVQKVTSCKLTALPPNPIKKCCGIAGRRFTIGSTIIGGTPITFEEIPWLGLIEYRDVIDPDDEIYLRCGGSLISGQYVLTAAHCVSGRPIERFSPVGVRLGEYNISTSGADCVSIEGGGEYCTDGAVSIAIEKIIVHSGYKNVYGGNDIALIKLARIVEYTDFIRPICLPTTDITTTSTNVSLIAAGWGLTETNKRSNIPLKVSLPYMTREVCQQLKGLNIRPDQFCTGGEEGKDTCIGDSGGPLMMKVKKRYDIVGIVSYGNNPCGQKDKPAVYTTVFEYLQWITSNINA